MNLATLIRQMAEAGAPPAAIAIAVEAIEAAQAAEAERRRKRAEQKAKERTVARQSPDVSQPVVRQVATSLPKKERVPPTPPLLEKTPTLFPASANAEAPPPEKNGHDFKALGDWFEGQWNILAAACGLSKTRGMTDKRLVLIRRRAEDLVGVLGFPDAKAGFADTFNRIRGSPHLRGENARQWTADIEWVLNETNFLKIHEGNYEKKPKPFIARR